MKRNKFNEFVPPWTGVFRPLLLCFIFSLWLTEYASSEEQLIDECNVYLEIVPPSCGLCNGFITANVPSEMVNGSNQWLFELFDEPDFQGTPMEINATLYPPQMQDELCPGTYSLRVTGLNGAVDGCVQEYNSIVLEDPQIGLEITTEPLAGDCGEANGSIIVNTNIDGDFSVTINPGGITQDFTNTTTITDLIPNAYFLTFESATGCVIELDPVIVESASSPMEITNIALSNPSCVGDTNGEISIDVDGGAMPLEYSIDLGLTWTTDNTYVGLSPGGYFMMVRDADDCMVNSGQIYVLEEPDPIHIFPCDFTSVACVGDTNGTIIINAAGGTGVLSYSINGGDNFFPYNSFSDLPADEYNISVRDANGCIQHLANPVVLEPLDAIVYSSVDVVDSSTCDANDASITINVNGGTPPYYYSIDGGGLYSMNNTFNDLAIGTYQIVVADGSACVTPYSSSVEITAEDGPCFEYVLPPIMTPDDVVVECGGSITPESTGIATASDGTASDGTSTGTCGDFDISYEDDFSQLTGCGNTGTIVRTWTAVDNCENEMTDTQLIIITDTTAPSITCLDNIELGYNPDGNIPSPAPLTLEANDGCSPPIVTHIEDEMTNSGCFVLILRTYQAEDPCGNTSECIQLISYSICDPDIPDPDPELDLIVPDDMIIECGSSIGPDNLGQASYTASDACSPLTLDYDDNLSSLVGCGNTGVIVRTWTLADDCDNVVTEQQIITVEDTTPPSIICPPDQDLAYNPDGDIPPVNISSCIVADECSDVIVIHVSDIATSTECDVEVVRTYEAFDECGNSTVCEQSFTYTVCDPTILTAIDDVEVTIVDHPITIDVTDNDNIPDGANVTICGITQPENGSVILVNGQVLYTPNDGFAGTDIFEYTICDEFGNQSTALVYVTIVDPNIEGTCDNDIMYGCTEPITPIVFCPEFCALGNEYEIFAATTTYNCSISILEDGCIRYVPLPGFEGLDQIIVTACNEENICDQVLINVSIQDSCNEPPIAIDDDFTTTEVTPIQFTVMDNDSDPDGDNLSICNYTQPSNGNVVLVDDTFVYFPDTGFSGTDTFEYTICDEMGGSDTATITIIVEPSCQAEQLCIEPMTPTEICVEFCTINNQTAEIVNVSTTYNCSIQNYTVGCFYYVSLPGTIGQDVIIVTACDNTGNCEEVEVPIVIGGCETGAPGPIGDENPVIYGKTEVDNCQPQILHNLSIGTDASDNVLIIHNNACEDLTFNLEVFNMNGIKVYEQTTFESLIHWSGVDQSNKSLPIGTYVYRVTDNQGALYKGTLVLMK